MLTARRASGQAGAFSRTDRIIWNFSVDFATFWPFLNFPEMKRDQIPIHSSGIGGAAGLHNIFTFGVMPIYYVK